MPLIESVPNVSEGRRREVVEALPKDRAVSVRVIRQGRAVYLVMKP